MTSEYLMQGIKAQLPYEELRENVYLAILDEKDVPKWEERFYCPDVYIDVCKKKMRNEIDADYFSMWFATMCNLLNEKYYDLADFFDSEAFCDAFSQKHCRKIISRIRDYDLKYRYTDCVSYHKQEQMKVIYLRFELLDHSASGEGEDFLYKCYIVDHAKKTYDIRIVDGGMLDYDLSKHYCYMWDEEYYADILREEEEEDGVDYTKPQKQFCEAEEQLTSLFFEEHYRRDKTLEL